MTVRVCVCVGNHEVMEILLYFGAVADHACKQGATALGISSQEGHEQCVTHLLQYGANPYKSDHCGRTPIKLAAKSNRNNVLRVLENFTKSKYISLRTVTMKGIYGGEGGILPRTYSDSFFVIIRQVQRIFQLLIPLRRA